MVTYISCETICQSVHGGFGGSVDGFDSELGSDAADVDDSSALGHVRDCSLDEVQRSQHTGLECSFDGLLRRSQDGFP